jgi:hypothetical protein
MSTVFLNKNGSAPLRSRRKVSAAKCFRWLAGLAFCAVFCAAAQAQAELRADSSQVETGNPLKLQLRLPADGGKPDSIDFSAWADVLPQANIVAETRWQADAAFFSKTLTALFFDADTLTLPALPIALRSGDTAYTNTLQIIVVPTPSPDDLNDLAPIKDILREPTRWTDYLPAALAVLGVLGLLALLFWLFTRKSKSRLLSRSIAVPPHELALRKLDLLAKKQLTAKGFVKEHYAELTFIVREFLEKQFAVPALESTTDETLRHLKSSAFPAPLHEPVRHLLEQSDLAKFAKITPSEAFHAESFDIAQKVVKDCSPEAHREF